MGGKERIEKIWRVKSDPVPREVQPYTKEEYDRIMNRFKLKDKDAD